MLLDFVIACPECDEPVWASETCKLTRTEYEWQCAHCDHAVYWRDIPDYS